jgi:trehalose 6-phosphate synthase
VIGSLAGRALIIGVDRLDYSKGIPQRLSAFELFLQTHPQWRGKVTYLQIAPKSRTEIPEYTEIEQEIGSAAGRINGAFGEADWTPIRYVNHPYSHSMLAGLYRAARVGLVTPLRDGMNLVAKEYVASQNPDDPDVLILSRFAGASLRNAKQRCWSILTIPIASRRLSGRRYRCRWRSGASGTARCSECSHTTTSNTGPTAF